MHIIIRTSGSCGGEVFLFARVSDFVRTSGKQKLGKKEDRKQHLNAAPRTKQHQHVYEERREQRKQHDFTEKQRHFLHVQLLNAAAAAAAE